LPAELLEVIFGMVKEDKDFKTTLSSVARANRAMYNVVIPKIYETVVINDRNRSMIGYGHGSASETAGLGKSMLSEN
jgi:hypothetical protein